MTLKKIKLVLTQGGSSWSKNILWAYCFVLTLFGGKFVPCSCSGAAGVELPGEFSLSVGTESVHSSWRPSSRLTSVSGTI